MLSSSMLFLHLEPFKIIKDVKAFQRKNIKEKRLEGIYSLVTLNRTCI